MRGVAIPPSGNRARKISMPERRIRATPEIRKATLYSVAAPASSPPPCNTPAASWASTHPT